MTGTSSTAAGRYHMSQFARKMADLSTTHRDRGPGR